MVANAGAAVGKMLGREHATLGGVGYAVLKLAANVTVAAMAVANASGDVLAQDGTVLAGAHGEIGELIRSADLVAQTPELTDWAAHPGQSRRSRAYAPTRRSTTAAARSSRE